MELRLADGRVTTLEVVGDPDATPVLLCHGLADSRLAAEWLRPVARDLGLRLIAPDRPGIGGADRRPLNQLADWTEDAVQILDALRIEQVSVLGVSGGGPFAAACAALIPGRVGKLMLVAPLGKPGWPTDGMAPGERFSLMLATTAPGFGGWGLGAFAALARRRPGLFLRLAETAQPAADVRALQEPDVRESFLTSYVEAFRQGSWGVTQDLRVLTRPWGFDLGSIAVPTWLRHGDADLTVPLLHARLYAEAIPGAQLQVFPGDGHFSIFNHAKDVLAALAD
jgi:pimeloyl-ACP methyl ester carboxylesterase